MKVLFKHTAVIEFERKELHALVESLHKACHLSKGENPINDLHYYLYKELGELYKEFEKEYEMDYPKKNTLTGLLE